MNKWGTELDIKKKFDFNSIRFKIWTYFTIFAISLILLVWGLQVFFLETYYERMKADEAIRITEELISAYNDDEVKFELTLLAALSNNDIYVKIENLDGTVSFSSSDSLRSPLYLQKIDSTEIYSELKESDHDTISMILSDETQTQTLAIASYLECTPTSESVLYVFSPLAPVASTTGILNNQLLYITGITIFIAAIFSIFLANKISKPIKDITSISEEMGKGNYNIHFKGGEFTEIVELADTLNSASTELEKTSMYQKDLIANVSHDLKTPLTMIRSYAELIKDISGDNPIKRASHLQVIIDETIRLNSLVSDMLNLSLMQSRKIELEKKNFDIVKSINSLLLSFNVLRESENYTFKLNAPKELMVFGDEQKIEQVLSNLISNAVKYCGRDKVIIINVKKQYNKALIEVVDHGIGIAPDELPHVWEKYYKSSTHHVRPTEGTGLGLSIVKQILSLHRAQYGVKSKISKGSTFWFLLPYSTK